MLRFLQCLITVSNLIVLNIYLHTFKDYLFSKKNSLNFFEIKILQSWKYKTLIIQQFAWYEAHMFCLIVYLLLCDLHESLNLPDKHDIRERMKTKCLNTKYLCCKLS